MRTVKRTRIQSLEHLLLLEVSVKKLILYHNAITVIKDSNHAGAMGLKM